MKFRFSAFASFAALLCIFGLLQGCRRPVPPPQAADAFFAKVSRGEFIQAYEQTAFTFQASQTPASFAATAKDLGLTSEPLTCQWTKVGGTGKETNLTGVLQTSTGRKVNLTLTLILERGQWRIFSLHTMKNAGDQTVPENRFSLVGKGVSFSAAANNQVPAEPIIRKLVEDSLVMFNDAVQRHSFAEFYSRISYSWQRDLTLHQLETAFKPFIDTNVNLGTLRSLTASFDTPPMIDADGVLNVVGHYPPQPYIVCFNLRFVYEMPHWKLLGVDVQLKK